VTCSLPTTQWSVHNGSKFDVQVNTTGHHQKQQWCIVRLKSTKAFVLFADNYHEWFVGVIIKALPTEEPPHNDSSDPCICKDGTKAGSSVKMGSVACEHICRGHGSH
jgi:hypothetical protein